MPKSKQLLSTADVAAILDVTATRVQQIAISGALPGVRIGRAWIFRVADVRKYAREGRRAVGRPRKAAVSS